TITVAMIISAVNAVTLTPSRAVSIFKTETGAPGREPHREALPWWVFGVGGGGLTLWLAQKYLPRRWGLPADPDALPQWLSWALAVAAFVPGALLGGALGWFVIRPVNAALGWFFRGFNRAFDRLTAAYGWVVGWSLRLSAAVLVVYVALLGLTV